MKDINILYIFVELYLYCVIEIALKTFYLLNNL